MKNINLLKKEKGGGSMKKVTLVVFCLLLAGLLSFSTAAQAGLVNGDLESGNMGPFTSVDTVIDGWSTWGGSGAYHDDYNHTSVGSRAVTTWHDDSGVYQDFTVTGGTKYTVSGWAYSPSTSAAVNWNGLMKVEWDEGTMEDVGYFYGDGVDANDAWKFISKDLTAPTSANVGRLVLYVTNNYGGNPTAGSIGWDDMSVEAVPEPASLILLGSGLLGLFGIGRRKQA